VRHPTAEELFEFVFTDSGRKLHLRILSRPSHHGNPQTQSRAPVLCTAKPPAGGCNRFEIKEINTEEMVFQSPNNPLTKRGVGIIVEKVPRGLRNSKPPEA
jgi:hypothetical protein